MIYIFTNLNEMDDYVQKFEEGQWTRARPPNQKQLDKLRMNGAGNGQPDLLDWFRSLCDIDATIPSELRRLSRRSGLKVKSYDIYEVNGYRFRSEKYEKSRGNLSTTNIGVVTVGVNDGNNNELEYYGVTNGVRRLERFGLVEVAHASCNPISEPFVLASQVKQVYYLPCPCKSVQSLNAWWVAYKVSTLGNLSIPSMDEYNDEDSPCIDIFQEGGLEGNFSVDIGLGLDDITSTDGFDEVSDPKELSMLIKQRNGVSEDNESVVEEERGSDRYFNDINEEEYIDPDDF